MRLTKLKSAIASSRRADSQSGTRELSSAYPAPIQLSLEALQSPNEKAREACQKQLGISLDELSDRIHSRIHRWDECAKNKRMQEEECRKSAADLLYWVDSWVWTVDPRMRPAPACIPFLLFPRQREYLTWRRERRDRRENGIIKKSRDMGITWLNSVDHVNCWLFDPGFKGGFGSRIEDLVDRKDDPDCIFEKLRFILRCLPDWMKPAAGEYEDHFMKLTNKKIGSAIIGEGGKNIGRGGRSSIYDVDEAEFLEQGKKADSALSENTPVIYWTSTVNIFNPSNIVREKRMKGTIPVFEFNWRQDPRKNEEWYKSRVATLDAVIVASEIDMDENAAAPGSVIPPAHIQLAMNRWCDRRAGGYDVLGVDIARGGADRTVIAPRRGFWVDRLVVHAGGDTPDGDTAAMQISTVMTSPNTIVNIDIVGVGSSPYDSLRRAGRKTRGIVGGASAVDVHGEYLRDRTSVFAFADLRSYLFWNLRELLDPKYGDLLELPPDQELAAELSTPTWKAKPLKKSEDGIQYLVKVESNDECKKRIGKSLDKASGLIYAFWDGPLDEDGAADWLFQQVGQEDADVFSVWQ